MLKKILAGGIALIIAYLFIKLILVVLKVSVWFIFNFAFIFLLLVLAAPLYVIIKKKLLK